MKLLNTYQSFTHKDDNGGGDKDDDGDDTNTATAAANTTTTKKKNETSFKQLDHFQLKGEEGDKK